MRDPLVSFLRATALGVMVAVGAAGIAEATTTCTFTTAGKTMRLDADCTTDETLFIPDGFTLDGRGHTITAIDPPGGAFLAAILQNAGAVANVRNVTLTASELANECEPDDNKLRGILFDGASGSITNNTIVDVNKSGQGSCPNQGANIFVRKLPFDGTHPATAKVTVRDNQITGFSQLGVSVIGDVRATVSYNTLEGLGGTGISASQQFGIAIQRGALATVSRNTITQTWTSPEPNTTGISVFESDRAQITRNVVSGSTFGIFQQAACIFAPSASDGGIIANEIHAQERGIFLIANGGAGGTCDPHVDRNNIRGNEVTAPPGVIGVIGIGLQAADSAFMGVVNGNVIKGNTVGGYLVPIFQSGDTNTIVQGNTILP